MHPGTSLSSCSLRNICFVIARQRHPAFLHACMCYASTPSRFLPSPSSLRHPKRTSGTWNSCHTNGDSNSPRTVPEFLFHIPKTINFIAHRSFTQFSFRVLQSQVLVPSTQPGQPCDSEITRFSSAKLSEKG